MLWSRDKIDELLSISDDAVERAMVVLFERQTRDEQNTKDAKYQNGIGFSSADAVAGTHFAQWLQGFNRRNEKVYPPKSLKNKRALKQYKRFCKNGEKPIDRARRIALKHSQQLVNEANSKIKNSTVKKEETKSTLVQDREIEALRQRLNKAESMKVYNTPDAALR